MESVADKTSAIRVSSVRAFPVGLKAFVNVETNYGVSGWGEINNIETAVACELARSLGSLLVGENPTRIENHWQRLYRAHRNLRGGAFMLHTVAALDMALWDIAGKLWGVPVYRLLGGPCRDSIRMYPSRNAVKVGPGEPAPFSGTPEDIAHLVKRVQDARAKVGPAGAVMFDAHSCLPPPIVIQFANALRSDDLLFLEEPWVPGNIEAMKRIRGSVRVPLATGERDRTIWEAREILEAQVVDILQPDCGHGGGISQMRKVAALAEAHYVPIAPHCTMSYLGLTASLHVASATPLFLIHEGYDGVLPDGVARKNWTKDDDGNVTLTEEPGLGVEVDESRLAALNAEPSRRFRWIAAKNRDGSVADY